MRKEEKRARKAFNLDFVRARKSFSVVVFARDGISRGKKLTLLGVV